MDSSTKELFDHAYTKALKFLSYRPRSEKEIIDYLLKKGFEQLIISNVLALLREQNFASDKEFAQWWIEQRQTYRAKGKLIIKNELRQKGISEEIIQETLNASQDDYKTAKAYFKKSKKRFEHLTGDEYFQKATAFLQRRGFAWDTIKKVIKDNE